MAEPPKGTRPGASGSGLQAAVSNAALMRSLNDPNPEIRKAAIQNVIRMRDSRAIEPLLAILQLSDNDARMHAARALPNVAYKEHLPALYPLLSHKDPFIRAAIARTLGKWGYREAMPTLIRALCDHENEVRNTVAKALGRLGEARWAAWLAQAPQFGLKATITREQHLLNTLTDDLRNAKSPQQRASAAAAMPLFRHPQATNELVRALSDDAADVRRAAAKALGENGDRSVMKKLLHMLDDKEEAVRKAAVEALDKLDTIKE